MVAEMNRAIFYSAREHAVDSLRLEQAELENAFLTLILGGLAGLPLMPLGLSLEVAPLVGDELRVMIERHGRGYDLIAEYAGSVV